MAAWSKLAGSSQSRPPARHNPRQIASYSNAEYRGQAVLTAPLTHGSPDNWRKQATPGCITTRICWRCTAQPILNLIHPGSAPGSITSST